MKFENTQVWGFEHALRGMRNPMNSWDKSDSGWRLSEGTHSMNTNDEVKYVIGENDMKLAQKLIKAGSEHRKFMRQIFVSVDITAPLYWCKEFDTYKVGTVANSTSTMHKLASTPITKECFEMDDYNECSIHNDGVTDIYGNKVVIEGDIEVNTGDIWETLISQMEMLRKAYLKTQKEKYWKELIRILPESWLQKRTVTLNYENLLAICGKNQRRYHKLNEWSGVNKVGVENFISWARNLEYASELIFLDELEEFE